MKLRAYPIDRLALALAATFAFAATGCESEEDLSTPDAGGAADARVADTAAGDVTVTGDGAAAADGVALTDGAAAGDGAPSPVDGATDGPANDAGADAPAAAELTCEVAIVGGGAGGLHTAFRLAPMLGEKVCLFEKETTLGGRIHDIPMNPNDPKSPVFGTGARRVMEGQKVLFDLAKELGITLEAAPGTADLINARGAFAFSKDALRDARYTSIMKDTDPDNDQETVLYNKLRTDPRRANATMYPDFRAYIQDVAGFEEYNFLRDMSRFRADFEYPLDTRGYLDYLDEEWDVCCEPSYPVGGMSSFIRGMEQKATAAGARVFKGEPVSRIEKAGAGYRLTTGKRVASAAKVVVAVPPVALDFMSGDVVDRLKALPQLQAIIAVRVVTITQWWPSRWWAEIKNPAALEDANVWRGWTTDHCVNFIEIPLEPYGVAQNVTRSVYDDDIRCVQFWEEAAKKGTATVEAEVKRGLTFLFNNGGVSSPTMVMVPNPTRTHVQVWPAAWHWVRAGAPYTNKQIYDWAVEPLAGENVALVGEAYNPQRSGWSDGAYKSSINLLTAKYGMPAPTLKTLKAAKRSTRSQGGH
jgi:glycine/D-amino acid oxidase-like deaminating enzyme